MNFLAIAGIALILASCTPSASSGAPDATTPPTPTSATPAAVCAHLAQVGCSEGSSGSCITTLNQIAITRVTDPHVACLMSATTVAAAQACGSVTCTASAPH